MLYFWLAIDTAVSKATPLVKIRNARYNNASPIMILASHSRGGSGVGLGPMTLLFVSVIFIHPFRASLRCRPASGAHVNNICLKGDNLRIRFDFMYAHWVRKKRPLRSISSTLHILKDKLNKVGTLKPPKTIAVLGAFYNEYYSSSRESSHVSNCFIKAFLQSFFDGLAFDIFFLAISSRAWSNSCRLSKFLISAGLR